MKLVLSFLILIIILLMFSSIKLSVKKCRVTNSEKFFLIYIGIYLFGKIRLLNIKFSPKWIKKPKMDGQINWKEIIDNVKLLNIKIERLNLYLQIGVDSAVLTAYISGAILAVLGILLKSSDYKNIVFKVDPVFKNINTINLNLDCICSVKIIHIIRNFYY